MPKYTLRIYSDACASKCMYRQLPDLLCTSPHSSSTSIRPIRCPIQAPRLFRKHISVATRNWGIRHIRPANPPMPSFNVSLSKTQSIHGRCVFIIQGDTKERYVKSTPPIIHAGLIRVCYLAVRRLSLACSRWPVPSYFPSRTYLSVCWPGTG